MRRKKITIFTLHTDTGGIERYVASLANMLGGDCDVEVVAVYNSGNPPAFEYEEGVRLHYLVDGVLRNASLKELVARGRIGGAIKELWGRASMMWRKNLAVRKAARECEAEIVITERPFLSKMVGKYCKKPGVVKIATEHNFHQNNKKYINRVVKSVRRFDYFVLPTEELHGFYAPLVGLKKCKKITYHLPNIPSKKSNLTTKNILAIGRFAPEKGFLDLLDVMKLIHKKDKKIKLYLLGDGEENKKIRAKISELGLDNVVVAPGVIGHDELAKYFYDSCLYVMSSHTECFGLVLAEAMSFGLPCVAFDSASGARELIKKDVGVLVGGRDKKKMAEVIVELVNNKEKMGKYQKAINKYVAKFSEDDAEAAWKKILKI